MLLGAPGLTTGSKDATRRSWPYYWEQGRYWGSWPYYLEQEATRGSWHYYRNNKLLEAPGPTTGSKDATRGSWPYY